MNVSWKQACPNCGSTESKPGEPYDDEAGARYMFDEIGLKWYELVFCLKCGFSESAEGEYRDRTLPPEEQSEGE